MGQMTRRSALLAGVALPGIIEAAEQVQERPGDAGQPKRFEELAGYELAGAVSGSALAILPLGSMEFHGPHNPLGADFIIVSGIAARVAARTGGLLFPAVTFTQCPSHTAHFAGTISVRPEVMTMYFEDILRGIVHLGFRRVFVLNGHDGNIGPGRGAVSKIANEAKDAALMFASWWEFVPGEKAKAMGLFSQSNGGHGHGGPLETSAVAAFRPDLVHLNEARDLPQVPQLSDGSPYFLQKATAEDWPGYSGRVSEASAEKGRSIVKISEDAIVQLIGNWLAHPDAAGSW
jgi:creatinine amidohydrolase